MLDIAIKEWAVVCDLLIDGQQTILLRKGGIHESSGPGVFELEYSRFVLFPSWLHQQRDMIRQPDRDRVQNSGQEPATVQLSAWAQATHIWRVPSRASLDLLADLHRYEPALLDMRWNYKPANPLYVVAVRVHRLADSSVKTIAYTPAYGGCRSWVPLSPGDAVDDAASEPVLTDEAYTQVIHQVDAAMQP